MLELKDNINWNDFLANLQPSSWYGKRETETSVDWLKRVSIKSSKWLEDVYERERNEYWEKDSFKFCFSILNFLRENNITKEQMGDELGITLDLSGKYDWRMSEMVKINNYIKK